MPECALGWFPYRLVIDKRLSLATFEKLGGAWVYAKLQCNPDPVFTITFFSYLYLLYDKYEYVCVIVCVGVTDYCDTCRDMYEILYLHAIQFIHTTYSYHLDIMLLFGCHWCIFH